MSRIAIAVASGEPHHPPLLRLPPTPGLWRTGVTQRGNRRMEVFFGAEDYRLCIELMSASRHERGVEV